MNGISYLVFGFLVALLVKPVGMLVWQALNYSEATPFDFAFKRLELWTYRVLKIDPSQEQNRKEYLASLFFFTVMSLLGTALILALQGFLPLNPEHWDAPSWHLNLNTTISFVTNTNWQSYSGEGALSYMSQMAALTVQNFVSPAVGISVAAALTRGLAREKTDRIGHFYVDLIRLVYYLFLPLSILFAFALIAEGVPQNFSEYVEVKTLEGAVQKIAEGPVASQEAIKILGTNGGGFFNANSAHPYENPTPLSNLLQMLAIVAIPLGQIFYFGKEVKQMRHAFYLLLAVALTFTCGFFYLNGAEHRGTAMAQELLLEKGNWEGKETRFGIFDSALYASVTTAVSCGAVNASHDSFTPIGGMVPMLFIQLGEVIFGGCGTGLYSLLLFVFMAIFIGGLIVGRTPEYLGKKIGETEMKMTMLATLSFVFVVLVFTAWAASSSWGTDSTGNSGPHGFSELLYAYSSTTATNGSAFGGLNANTPWLNVTLALAMGLGRFLVMVPVLFLASAFAEKQKVPPGAGTFPIEGLLFSGLVIGVIFLIGALTFAPALVMGPILEELTMWMGALY
jgi:K+-transporting ATPase ATPase A chain